MNMEGMSPERSEGKAERELTPAELSLMEAKDNLERLGMERIAMASFAEGVTAEQEAALAERTESAQEKVRLAEEAVQEERRQGGEA